MSDALRRYLRQQAELGGAEAVLSRPLAELPRPTGKAAPSAEPPAEETDMGAKARRELRTPPAAAPAAPVAAGTPHEAPRGGKDWRTGAPPIPGPGLVIAPPPQDLLAPRAWDTLEQVAQAVAGCTKCFLAKGRTNVVPGEGNPRAQLVLVGEGPGQTEDQTGRPFVGRAGELLNGILAAIGYAREEVFICNVVKCRPPQNRKPLPDEMAACSPFLSAQLAILKPRVILALGATAAEALLQAKRSLSDLRGKVHSYHGIPLVVTYHPAALLRNPAWKKPTWDDVRIARQLVDVG
ncbi:MAG: uracil-DNA glycosylase family protein [Gemmatimonadales bacterium]